MRKLYSDLALLVVTVLWGCAFVAQRLGLEHLGPFGFNACRFLLGGILVWIFYRIAPDSILGPLRPAASQNLREHVWHGIGLGALLFLGATFQQVGLVTTSAGKAGFLTVLYVIFVPILSRFFGYRVLRSEYVGALLALFGSYYLSISSDFTVEWGDVLVILSAVTWAFHAIAVSKGTEHVHPLVLAYQQFFVCAVLSLVVAFMFEEFSFTQIWGASAAIFYAGGLSIAIGYTVQVVAQRFVSPAYAVIVFSLEGVFATLAGWFFLGETFTSRAILGALLVLFGVLVAQNSRIFSGKGST